MTEQILTVDKNNSLCVICHDCPRVLYETERQDRVTNAVAQFTLAEHSNAFTNRHYVSIVVDNTVFFSTEES